ncbi:hypothetical protein GCM10027416_30470 [Okibacterium endophyticum]
MHDVNWSPLRSVAAPKVQKTGYQGYLGVKGASGCFGLKSKQRDVAQLGSAPDWGQGVAGSNPVSPTEMPW